MANSEYINYGSPSPHTSYGSPPPSGAANPGGNPPPSGSPLPPPARSSNSETIVAGIAHLSSFFAPLICPLIIWLITRDSMPYASRQGKQAFFFHLLMSALGVVAGLALSFVFLSTLYANVSQTITSSAPAAPAFPPWFFALITFAIIIGLAIQALCVYGAVQAFQGKDFSYPLLSRL